MIALKRKQTIVLFLVGLVVLLGTVYFLKDTPGTEKSVKIVNYGVSICTQDIPTSECGPYNVTAETSDGKRDSYEVAGFSNRQSKLYNEITAKITTAKQQNKEVILMVNHEHEIVSVR